jgi:hypothetical protein
VGSIHCRLSSVDEASSFFEKVQLHFQLADLFVELVLFGIGLLAASASQQQCELLGVSRSTYYYKARPESAENLRLLRRDFNSSWSGQRWSHYTAITGK